jgi:RNA polymerase sigma-70 factor (ECF subfamily)
VPEKSESGDRDFARLLLQYRTRIYAYIRSLVAHRADAEDLLQETASVLWRKFDAFQPGSNFLAWALQVARYEVLAYRQRRKRDVLQFSDNFLDALADETVAESARLADLQELLDQCMDKLPAADRELIDLRYRSDLPVKALAAQLGRPLSTTYDALNRIRRNLVECVQRALSRAGEGIAGKGTVPFSLPEKSRQSPAKPGQEAAENDKERRP